jgi:hypothetical protein
MANDRTRGEILLEQYLSSQGLAFEFEKEHVGKSKRPDYTIAWRGSTIVLDVKDFDPPYTSPGASAFDPYPRIREKIDQGRDKFKQYKELCCGLVLCNLGHPFVRLQEPDIMLGAMYGDAGFTFPVNTATGIGEASKIKRAFLGRGKMLRPMWSQAQNTTISAIITLSAIQPHYLRLLDMIQADPARDIEDCQSELQRTVPDYDPMREVPRVIVWHNAVARIPFPTDLFCGSYDTHFGIVNGENGVTQEVTFRGDALPNRVSI